MKKLLKAIGIVCAVCGLAAGVHTATAHHSTSMFDRSKKVILHGIVKEVRWVNPHVSVWVNGALKEGEEPNLWVLETTSPSNLVRRGWSRTSIKLGDKVVIELSPLQDSAKKGGALNKVTLVDSGLSFQSDIRDEAPGGG